MPAVGAYNAAAMLNWSLNAQAVTRPTAWGVGLSLGSPTSASGSEIGTGSGYARQSGSFAAAASPAGSCSNAAAMTFGPFSTGCTISGIQVWDTMLSANSGDLLYFGLLATPRTLGVGDSIVFNAGALTITMT